MNRFISYRLLTIGFGLMLNSCFDNPDRPSVTTIPPTVISSDKTSSGLILNSDGGGDIIEKGVIYSNLNPPTIGNERILFTEEGVIFNATIQAVKAGTTYIRAYAINGAGISYGETLSYNSIEIALPFIDPSDKTALCRISTQSENSVTVRGICWNTSGNPSITDNKIESNSSENPLLLTITGLTPSTLYFARAYGVSSNGVFYSGPINFTTKSPPNVTTKEFSNVGTYIVTSGGTITATGLATISKAGICWSTHPSPTIADFKTEDYEGDVAATYASELSGLIPNSTYYVRAYATNSVGTAYGNERMITTPVAAMIDADGNPYSSVTIGSQVWTTENLQTTRFSNGDAIMNITNDFDWKNANSGAWSYYANVETNNHPYGKLYNWFAVSDARNICATGWHVPVESEWITLIDFLGGDLIAGSALRENGDIYWRQQNSGATNSSGFTALPGGGRSVDGDNYPIKDTGVFWSSTSIEEYAWGYSLNIYNAMGIRINRPKRSGFSVRCLKD